MEHDQRRHMNGTCQQSRSEWVFDDDTLNQLAAIFWLDTSRVKVVLVGYNRQHKPRKLQIGRSSQGQTGKGASLEIKPAACKAFWSTQPTKGIGTQLPSIPCNWVLLTCCFQSGISEDWNPDTFNISFVVIYLPRLLIQKPPVLARAWLKVRLTSMPKVAYFWLQPMSMATGTFRGSMPSWWTFRKAAKAKALALLFFGNRPGRSAACIGSKASDSLSLPSFLGHLKGLLQESLRIATMKSLCLLCATA